MRKRVMIMDDNFRTYAGEYTSYEFAETLKKVKGVIIPVGSCEQHGRHLPLDTDNIIGTELARRIGEKNQLLVLPTINYGQVWSAKGIPGTMCLSSDTLKTILKDIVISLEQQDAKNIILFTGHNGNFPIFKEFAREMLDNYGYKNIWHFPQFFSKDILTKCKSKPISIMHGGEAETSMMLYIRPDLVHMDLAPSDYPEIPKDLQFRPIHWNEFMNTGTFGGSNLASAELGKEIVENMIEQISKCINSCL